MSMSWEEKRDYIILWRKNKGHYWDNWPNCAMDNDLVERKASMLN